MVLLLLLYEEERLRARDIRFVTGLCVFASGTGGGDALVLGMDGGFADGVGEMRGQVE